MKDNIALMLPELNVSQLNMLYRHIELEKTKAVHDFIHKVKLVKLPVPRTINSDTSCNECIATDTQAGTSKYRWAELPR